MIDLASYYAVLLGLTRTYPARRIRHCADALLLVADGQTMAATDRTIHTSGGRLRA